MVKLQQKGGQYTITIPQVFVEDKGWLKGQKLAIAYDPNGNLVLKEVVKK